MARIFTFILAFLLCLGLPQVVQAEALTSLQTCADVPAFVARQTDRVSALEAKLEALPAGSAKAVLVAQQIDQVNRRFDGYSSLLCGEEGLPHLMTDGRLNHAGEFIIPGLAFLYIAGWLGWSGRIYLIKARATDSPESLESTIDIPMALQCFAAALAWPVAAFREIASGEIRVAEDAVPISPR